MIVIMIILKLRQRLETANEKAKKLAANIDKYTKEIDSNCILEGKETFKKEQNRERNIDLSKKVRFYS